MKNRKILEDSKEGFTIVELTLTMSFVAVLMITIAVITTNILAIYQKGMTIKAVNNVGRGLIDSLSDSIMSAPALSTATACAQLGAGASEQCKNNNATQGFSYHAYENDDGYQLYGVFCTGSYSYLWNTTYAFEDNKILGLKYYDKNVGDTVTISPTENEQALRLLRIQDSTRRVCSASIDKSTYENVEDWGQSMNLDVTRYVDARDGDSDSKYTLKLETPETNLLANNDAQLVLHELTIFPRNENTTSGRAFYAGTFVLATERGGFNVKSANEYCQNSETSSTGNLGAEFNYCALNKFNFAARTAGE